MASPVASLPALQSSRQRRLTALTGASPRCAVGTGPGYGGVLGKCLRRGWCCVAGLRKGKACSCAGWSWRTHQARLRPARPPLTLTPLAQPSLCRWRWARLVLRLVAASSTAYGVHRTNASISSRSHHTSGGRRATTIDPELAHRPPIALGERVSCEARARQPAGGELSSASGLAGAVRPVYAKGKSAAAQDGLGTRTRHGPSQPDHRYIAHYRRSRRWFAGTGPGYGGLLSSAFGVAGAVWPVYATTAGPTEQDGVGTRISHRLSSPDHRPRSHHRPSHRCPTGAAARTCCLTVALRAAYQSQQLNSHSSAGLSCVGIAGRVPSSHPELEAAPPDRVDRYQPSLCRWYWARLRWRAWQVPPSWLVLCGRSTQGKRVQLRRMVLAHVPGTA